MATRYYSSTLKRVLTDEEAAAAGHGVLPSPTGLGDLVAKVAQPIAGMIDAVAGTKLKTCSACAQRKARLNRLVPDISRPGRSLK